MSSGYEPTTAELREGESVDETSHARAQLAQLVEGFREGDVDAATVEKFRAAQRARGVTGDE